MNLNKKLQHKYALSDKGAADMMKAFIAVTLSNIALMLPVGLLYFIVEDMINRQLTGRGVFYIVGSIIGLVLIGITTYIQYNCTFLSTYVESGVRRTALAEKLRKIPLSFFGKKDLADLTSTIMSDCATLETASSHWIPELIGSLVSTVIIAASLFLFEWKMAIAALWVLPVAFVIVLCSSKVVHSMGEKHMKLKMDCADGIQECLETVKELKANNAKEKYMQELEMKIRAAKMSRINCKNSCKIF